ncbi:MAG: hypothetical protein IT529_04200 [Burkholderiales bacterium]|nr:hypothetical protein [Burkholderiales bacterium]
MRIPRLICGLGCVALAAGAAAQEGGGYASDLSRVFAAAQYIQAVREGCDAAKPDTRTANDAAYGAWRKRHQSLLDELDRRFMAMIRGASADQKEYQMNIGKYAGEVLRNLEEAKVQFLAQGPEPVERQCREFPQYLKGKDADLARRYAEELKSIRKRKL